MDHRNCPLCHGKGSVPQRPSNVLPFPRREIPPERMTDQHLIATFREAFPFLTVGTTL